MVVLLASAGRFAGAVFKDDVVQKHRSLARYTVRAKQGGAQASKDAQGRAPKSVGSSLRRYNTVRLQQDVDATLALWADDINNCDLLILGMFNCKEQLRCVFVSIS